MKKYFLLLVLTLEIFSLELTIFQGWNLVGATKPNLDLNKTMSNYKSLTKVWSYNSSSQNWEFFSKNETSSSFKNINYISAGYGFWVYNNGSELIVSEIDKEDLNISGTTFNYSLKSGWNLISFLGDVSTFAQSFGENSNLSTIWSYDNLNKKWLLFSQNKISSSYETFSDLVFGKAFWVKNSSSATIDISISLENSLNSNEQYVSNRTIYANGDYVLLAWNDLGMHCMDDNYSIFSILPPANNLRATLIKKGSVPILNNSSISVTFEATKNLSGSTNVESSSKTDFWKYSQKLYGVNLSENEGLSGFYTSSIVPQELISNSENSLLEAKSIPITPINDDGSKDYYQLVDVVAKDSSGNVVASTKAVLPVSDEMNCKKCHSSNSDWISAKPKNGWTNNQNNVEDYKLNILKLHDDNHSIEKYLDELKSLGYDYNSSLYETAKSGTPILCSSCHRSNALGTLGIGNIPQLTTAIHSSHASVVDSTGETLNSSTTKSSCYNCHPGKDTSCLRGAMGGDGSMSCQNCHGDMKKVGSLLREGWIDEPNCGNCHQNGERSKSVFEDSSYITLREVVDTKFSSNLKSDGSFKLYKDSFGHGKLSCQACHGSQHSIYPSVLDEDNLQSNAITGHSGTIGECSSCHKTSPLTLNKGPHGMHSISQWWVDNHEDYAEDSSNRSNCAKCHGSDYRGSDLSKTFSNRIFSVEKSTKKYLKGDKVSCYDCHNGPY